MTRDESDVQPDPELPTPESEAPNVVDAAELLGGAREVCLEFQGVRYRLRVTRRGRLLLQK